jgi:phosphatidylserine/phosphatidylglycerophosphate/cardiolipin synthase-like enzyme
MPNLSTTATQNIEIIKDNTFQKVLVDLLYNAKKEILISTFRLQYTEKHYAHKLSEIWQALIQAKKRGIEIKILSNGTGRSNFTLNSNARALSFLRSNGIDVFYSAKRRLIHAKVIIIDQCMILLGSHNITFRAIQSNFEVSLLIRSPGLAEKLRQDFFAEINV